MVDPTRGQGHTLIPVTFELPTPGVRVGSSASERTVWTNEYTTQGVPCSLAMVGSGRYRAPTGNDDWNYTTTPSNDRVLNIDFTNLDNTHNGILWQRAHRRAQAQTGNEIDIAAMGQGNGNQTYAFADTFLGLYNGDSHDNYTKLVRGWAKFTRITYDLNRDRLEHRPVPGYFIAPAFKTAALEMYNQLVRQKMLHDMNNPPGTKFGFDAKKPIRGGLRFIPQFYDLVPPTYNDVFEIPSCFFLNSKVNLQVVTGTRDSLRNVRPIEPIEDVETFINDSEILARYRNITTNSIPLSDRFSALRAAIKKFQDKRKTIEERQNELAAQVVNVVQDRTLDAMSVLERVKEMMAQHTQLDTITPNQRNLLRIYDTFMSDVPSRPRIVNHTDLDWNAHSQDISQLDNMRNYSHWGVWTDRGPLINITQNSEFYVSGHDLDLIWSHSFPHLSTLTDEQRQRFDQLWRNLLQGQLTYGQFWQNLLTIIPDLAKLSQPADTANTASTNTSNSVAATTNTMTAEISGGATTTGASTLTTDAVLTAAATLTSANNTSLGKRKAAEGVAKAVVEAVPKAAGRGRGRPPSKKIASTPVEKNSSATVASTPAEKNSSATEPVPSASVPADDSEAIQGTTSFEDMLLQSSQEDATEYPPQQNPN